MPTPTGPLYTPDLYAEDIFFTRASDAKGHSDYMRSLRIEPSVYARIGELIATKAIPAYRSPSDFVRDAAVHRLHWLEENLDDPVFSASLKPLVAQTAWEARHQQAMWLVERVERWSNEIPTTADKMLSLKMYENLVDYLDEAEEFATECNKAVREKLMGVVEHYRSRVGAALAAVVEP